MTKEEIAPGIVVYSNVMDGYEELPQDIEDVVDSGLVTWFSAQIEGGENKKIRNTNSIHVPFLNNFDVPLSSPKDFFETNLSEIFFNAFNTLENDYKMQYGIDFSDHSPYDVLKYGKGQLFTNHIDDHTKYPRRISLVYYFNDNYEGGEINFPRLNLSFKPKANQLLMFPSSYVYNHSVSEVTDGTRYAVVSWIN